MGKPHIKQGTFWPTHEAAIKASKTRRKRGIEAQVKTMRDAAKAIREAARWLKARQHGAVVAISETIIDETRDIDELLEEMTAQTPELHPEI